MDEVQPPDLIDGHINMSMEKTAKRIEAMKHEVMFIDEASQLFPKSEGETHFGYQCVQSPQSCSACHTPTVSARV
jgi:hypothetical protein